MSKKIKVLSLEVTSHPQMKEFTHRQLKKVYIEPLECYMKCL